MISGLTVIRNATELGYPFTYAVRSIIDVCDEFVISEGPSTDDTHEIVEGIREEWPDKVKVVPVEWKPSHLGKVIANATNVGVAHCSGDWIYYIQADEIVHEANLGFIKTVPERLAAYNSVAFGFLHFRPDIHHILAAPAYTHAIRMFKNLSGGPRTAIRRILSKSLPSLIASMTRTYLGLDFGGRLSDIYSFGDGWTFAGNVSPTAFPSSVQPLYHLNWVHPSVEEFRNRAVSHGESVYLENPGYREFYENALSWDGRFETFWQPTKEYHGDYPRLLLEWHRETFKS